VLVRGQHLSLENEPIASYEEVEGVLWNASNVTNATGGNATESRY